MCTAGKLRKRAQKCAGKKPQKPVGKCTGGQCGMPQNPWKVLKADTAGSAKNPQKTLRVCTGHPFGKPQTVLKMCRRCVARKASKALIVRAGASGLKAANILKSLGRCNIAIGLKASNTLKTTEGCTGASGLKATNIVKCREKCTCK
eukprot:jgi/Botrbrau1/18325/Bobra.0179s0053.1